MITSNDIKTLVKLAIRIQAAPVMDTEDIVRCQRLVTMGLARDLSAFHGTRIPIRLRIWSITDAGRAVLEQKSFTDSRQPPKLNLPIPPTPKNSKD